MDVAVWIIYRKDSSFPATTQTVSCWVGVWSAACSHIGLLHCLCVQRARGWGGDMGQEVNNACAAAATGLQLLGVHWAWVQQLRQGENQSISPEATMFTLHAAKHQPQVPMALKVWALQQRPGWSCITKGNGQMGHRNWARIAQCLGESRVHLFGEPGSMARLTRAGGLFWQDGSFYPPRKAVFY